MDGFLRYEFGGGGGIYLVGLFLEGIIFGILRRHSIANDLESYVSQYVFQR